uniref:Uncharacterized protein n=1 Tax=Hordeum vulgare subsp. vulgare TaxID=112509 RepID=A0A8I6YZF7_HORVV
MRQPRSRPATCPSSWTLGQFLAAATKQLNATLPSPGKRPRPTLNFSPRRGRSAATLAAAAAPPRTERRAQVQILRTLGIGIDQPISAAEMKDYDDLFATPIQLSVLHAMASLVDREIPECLSAAPNAAVACVR